jgi:hypothetical protein
LKNTLLAVVLVLVALSATAFSEPLDKRDEFGLGAILGEPSGVNAQFYWGARSSIGVTAAWSLRDWFFVSADYQVLNRLGDAPPEWHWFYGIGAYLGTPTNSHGLIGGRIPLGIKYRIPGSVVDIWGEVVPALQLLPDTQGEIHGGIGVTSGSSRARGLH